MKNRKSCHMTNIINRKTLHENSKADNCGRKYFRISCIVLFLVLSSTYAHADIRYVSDRLVITVKNGSGIEYKTIKTLRSDTPVDVMEQDGLFLKVRTMDGVEGWVNKKYITTNKPKAKIISELNKEIEKLHGNIAVLKTDKLDIQKEMNDVKQSYATMMREYQKKEEQSMDAAENLSEEFSKLKNKYQEILKRSKNTVELYEENERLKIENRSFGSEVTNLKEENKRYKQEKMLWWFLAGAGVFLIGLLFGFSSKKRKYYIDV